MEIETLETLKTLSSEALKGRKKLKKLNEQYIRASKASMSRARTTTYNAKCADIMKNTVEPAERMIKQILENV